MGVRIGGGRKHAGLAGAQSVPASSGGTMMWRQFSRRSKQRRYNQSCKTTLQKI
jgi:hypothetical protein